MSSSDGKMVRQGTGRGFASFMVSISHLNCSCDGRSLSRDEWQRLTQMARALQEGLDRVDLVWDTSSEAEAEGEDQA